MLLLFIHLHHLFEHDSFKFEREKAAKGGGGEQVEKQRHIVFDMLLNILSNNNTTSMDHSTDRYAFSPSQLITHHVDIS